ncbi:spore germination protein GerW family protein [Clostridium sp. CCUG 7971]|uniref:spore germination protein GerW family protein n=1 Tax=Clostridium sp. CCUG 7971 TaxID=2811414 RepID=UPI001ABBBAFC|nr:spore germination protein GerW family protein [Clostridium sp. CCUG 7971]MBO3446251.1 sporulation protein YtfJ [Clostridium sp. CCUG 7971]
MRATGSIKSLMETTLETINGSIDANTIVGDPIQTDTTVVVPISKITVGFGIGGGEYSKGYDQSNKDNEKIEDKNDTNFAGGSAGAISVQPVAFVVVENGETRLMSLDSNINLVDNILTVTPRVIEKIQKLSKNNSDDNKNKQPKKPKI